MTWRTVTSKKPKHKGEVFVMHGDKFVLKIYADATPDNQAFGAWLVKNLQACEDKKNEQGTGG